MIRAQSGQSIGAELVNATTGAAFVGTVTVYVTIDAGVQAIGSVGSGLCASEGNGYFTYLPSTAETDGALIAFTFIGTGAVPATIQVATVTVTQAAQLTAGPAGSVSGSVRALVVDALAEIGVLEPGESLSPAMGAIGLLRAQKMFDAWQADRLSLAVQTRTTFTLTSGTSTVTLGPSGATVTMARPLWIDTVTYINPSSSPSQEISIAPMDRDTYAQLTIKSLPSALPVLYFYQTSVSSGLGSLFIWPQASQNVDMVLYTPQGIGVPLTLNDTLTGPPGYAEAFMYNLALRLCRPTGTAVPDGLPSQAANAMSVMRRPNTIPAVLGVDPATTQRHHGHSYNVYSDTW